MKPTCLVLSVGAVALAAAFSGAQNYAPPPSKPPDDATRQAIDERLAKLNRALATLRQQSIRDPWLAEVDIFRKAAVWMLRHKEFYDTDAGQWTVNALDRGLLRARQLLGGDSPWVHQFGQPVVRAYRSRIDGSVQPYAVTWPKDYGANPGQKWRLDVVLHGRDPSLTEVKFLHHYAGDAPASPEPAPDYVRLDIFGRGNVGYRWAGETDIFEALDHFVSVERLLGRDALLDPARVVLRGFSMGGAGTWHLGLHRPDRWCVLGPGAGFVSTHGYVKNLPDPLPRYQEACLRIYDAADYAANAFNVPVVAYAGADDPQLQAARTIEERLKPLHIPMKLLVAPSLGHQFPPEWRQKAEAAYSPFAGPGKGRSEYPEQIRFVTFTLRYPSCNWVEVLGLDRHYEQSLVDASRTETGFTVKTHNVRALRLGLPAGALQGQTIAIDEQQVQARPHLAQSGAINIYLERQGQHWQAVPPQKLVTNRLRHRQKLEGLQGPIDDAFMNGFLCVRGTGKAWHEVTSQFAEAALQRFKTEWNKYLRGDLPVKDDSDVTDEDIAGRHLILFGDPSSNSLLAQVLDALPLKWTADSVTLAGGDAHSAGEHVPVMIYPSPLNSERYLVLNSGHTFHMADFLGTNALLYPRLGDFAVLKPAPTDQDPLAVDVVEAGLFDDFWQVRKEP
jgi:predicted esterase